MAISRDERTNDLVRRAEGRQVVNSNPAEPDGPPQPSPLQRPVTEDADHAPRAGTQPIGGPGEGPAVNPKQETHPGDNTEKDPDDWVSRDEPMTGAQASYLKTLSEQAHEEAFETGLTKAEASRRIDALKAKTSR